MSVATTTLPEEAVLEVARASFDTDTAVLRRQPRSITDREVQRAWEASVAFYEGQILRRPELYQDDLLRTTATRNLITNTIAAFGLIETETLRASESAAVRRARAFIDDNLRRPITVQDVAHAARLGPRALHDAFRKQRGETPMGYLRAGRLAGARTELLAADASTGLTVGGVAASWGFSNRGRFAAAFRDTFGESPTETLQR